MESQTTTTAAQIHQSDLNSLHLTHQHILTFRQETAVILAMIHSFHSIPLSKHWTEWWNFKECILTFYSFYQANIFQLLLIVSSVTTQTVSLHFYHAFLYEVVFVFFSSFLFPFSFWLLFCSFYDQQLGFFLKGPQTTIITNRCTCTVLSCILSFASMNNFIRFQFVNDIHESLSYPEFTSLPLLPSLLIR